MQEGPPPHLTMPITPAVRGVTALVATVCAVALAAVFPGHAAAHDAHTALPEGFVARVGDVQGADGDPVELDAVSFAVAPTGMAITATNTTDSVLEIAGEQAGEPLLRVTATEASVNERSPQAAGVEGASVSPDAAADLLDLLWKRSQPSWVALPRGGSVTFVDHRAVPDHPPVRAEHSVGDVVSTWKLPFTYDGTAYTLRGDVVMTQAPPAVPWPALGAAAASIAAAVLLARRRRQRSSGTITNLTRAEEREPHGIRR